jgi:hypothetical protein
MTNEDLDLVRSWARLGILFNCAPAEQTPDLERLLLATARRLHANPRLYPTVVTWLVDFGNYVARHRLARLCAAELDRDGSAALGLLIETAIEGGAPADLRSVLERCEPLQRPRPLFGVHMDRFLAPVAERTASTTAKKWGLWAAKPELKREAIRPIRWMLEVNPGFRERAIRKGDLRCSIVESLHWDSGGTVESESQLARLTGATRAAVRKALAALVSEGELTVARHAGNRRDNVITLRTAA